MLPTLRYPQKTAGDRGFWTVFQEGASYKKHTHINQLRMIILKWPTQNDSSKATTDLKQLRFIYNIFVNELSSFRYICNKLLRG